MTDIADDKVAVRELIENWAVWRDARLWDRFRTVWHAEGRMMATWFQGGFEEFIKVNDEGWARGVRILHFLGGSTIDVAGHRAISQTKMTISQRGPLDGVICDVLCTGRFFDFFEKRDGRWVSSCASRSTKRIAPIRWTRREAGSGPDAAQLLSGGLPPSRVSAGQSRLQSEDRHAGYRRARA